VRHPGLIIKHDLRLSDPDEMLLLMRWIRTYILGKRDGCLSDHFRITMKGFKSWLRSNGIIIRQNSNSIWSLILLELALLKKAGMIGDYHVLRTDRTHVIIRKK